MFTCLKLKPADRILPLLTLWLINASVDISPRTSFKSISGTGGKTIGLHNTRHMALVNSLLVSGDELTALYAPLSMGCVAA